MQPTQGHCIRGRAIVSVGKMGAIPKALALFAGQTQAPLFVGCPINQPTNSRCSLGTNPSTEADLIK